MDFLATSLWAILISTMRKVLVLSSEKVATTCDNAKSIGFIGYPLASSFVERKMKPAQKVFVLSSEESIKKYGDLLASSLKHILEFLITKLEEK